ncbi:MAG: MATE family efflux transporter [Candidatus Hydrogenedentota bacterium]
MKSFEQNLLSGNIVASVWKFSWPVVLMNLINGVHGIIDQILVGHYVPGDAANAAIGMSWTVFLVVFVTLGSLFHGMAVYIAQYAGTQDRENMNRVLFHTFLGATYLVLLVIAPVGYLLAPHIMDIMNATAETKMHATPYLRILFTSGLTLSFNFMLGMAFQSSGDSRTPLYLVTMTTLLNVLISTILISGAGPFEPMGTTGAALGTCLAPIPSLILGFYLILTRKAVLGPPAEWAFLPDMEILRKTTRIGIYTAGHAVALNIGGILLYWFIGSLESGESAQAAYTICYAQLFSMVTWAGLGLRGAASTLIGQNIGAGQIERGRRSVHIATAMGAIWAILCGGVFWLAPGLLLSVFDASDQVMVFGSDLLRYLGISGVFLVASLALTGGLIGAGDTFKPMVIAMVTQIGILLGLCWIFQWMGVLSTSTIWLSILVSHTSRFILTAIVFERGSFSSLVADVKTG